MATITTPDAVPGEVIEAAWGDAVRADLNALNAAKYEKTGGTISGSAVVTGSVTVDGATGIIASTGPIAATNNFIRSGGQPQANDLNGSELQHQGQIRASQGQAGQTVLWLRRLNPGAGTGELYARFMTTNALTYMGGIAIASGTTVAYNTSSDKRLKRLTRVVDPDEAVAKLAALEPVNFVWNGYDADGEQVGFFAQDLAVYAPEAVTPGTGNPGDEPDPDTGEGGFIPWSTDLTKLIPTLVAAIQALTARIQVLEEATP